MPVTIRRVRESDVDAVVGMVHDLAEFEKAPQDCHLTAPQLHTALFGDSPRCSGTSPRPAAKSSASPCGS